MNNHFRQDDRMTRPPIGHDASVPPSIPSHHFRPMPGGQGQPEFNPTMVNFQPKSEKPSGNGLILAIVVGVALLLGFGGTYWFLNYHSHKSSPTQDSATALLSEGENTDNAATTAEQPDKVASDAAAESGSLSLFNRPLHYAGTVTPGGATSLNIILFKNGRIEGTIDYSSGKSQPVYGSFTLTDNRHKLNVKLTVNSNSDRAYSESWTGTSSYIKDDLAHTLTFNHINTSTGQSMTASFALKP